MSRPAAAVEDRRDMPGSRTQHRHRPPLPEDLSRAVLEAARGIRKHYAIRDLISSGIFRFSDTAPASVVAPVLLYVSFSEGSSSVDYDTYNNLTELGLSVNSQLFEQSVIA